MKLNIGLFGIDFEGIENNQYTRYGTGGSGTINIGGHEYLIQCPDVIDENTTFYVAGRGAGGIGDTYSTLDAAKGKNVIVIAPVYQKPGDYSGSINVANELADHFGIDANVSFSGHSNSGPQCMEAAQEYIRSTGNPTTIVLNDPSVMGGSDSNIDYSVFKDSVIIDYAPNGGGATANYMSMLKEAAANGANGANAGGSILQRIANHEMNLLKTAAGKGAATGAGARVMAGTQLGLQGLGATAGYSVLKNIVDKDR